MIGFEDCLTYYGLTPIEKHVRNMTSVGYLNNY